MPVALLLAQGAVAQDHLIDTARPPLPREPGPDAGRLVDTIHQPHADPRAPLPRGTPTEKRLTHAIDVAATTTSWTRFVRVPLFDPANGLLQRIELTLAAELTGDASVESLDLTQSETTLHFSAAVGLRKPAGNLLIEVRPRQDFVDQLQPFDGTVDFGGASGASHLDIVLRDDGVPLLAQAADLAFFTGGAGESDSIDMIITAEGTSSSEGPGNMATAFHQAAAVHGTITYVFEEDCNGNGVPDVTDVASSSSGDLNANAVPDECESVMAFCFGDGPQNGGPECPCGNQTPGNTAGCLNSTGRGAGLGGTGSARVGQDTLQLSGTGFPSGSATIWIEGKSEVNGGLGVIFGSGLACVNQPTRFATLTAPPSGALEFPRPGDPRLSEKLGILPGEERMYQVWYRDTSGPCGVNPNTTNAVSVMWR